MKFAYEVLNLKEKIMASIRIVSLPPGFADISIRNQWIGVTIPLVPEEEIRKVAAAHRSEVPTGYTVRGTDAVRALRSMGRPTAADFWSSPAPPGYLTFAQDCCELI